MTYATLDALVDRYGQDLLLQVADRASPPSGVVDMRVVTRAQADADATVDASIAVRYRLPLANVPAIVADIAAAIAIYKLHRFTPDAKIKDEYDQALRDLRDIADGRKKLDLDGVEPQTSGAGGVVAIDRARPLTPENLKGFI
jgi:phage gp36-like protein